MKSKRTRWAELKLVQAARTRMIVQRLKEDTPCADCGNKYPHYIMEFDHRHGKIRQVSQLMAASIVSILREIAKCDIVCANCHRARTHKRRGCKYKTLDTPFRNWLRPHIASLVPRKDGKILAICSNCGGKYWAEPSSIRWCMSKPQSLVCSVPCGLESGNGTWKFRHKKEILEYLSFKKRGVARVHI